MPPLASHNLGVSDKRKSLGDNFMEAMSRESTDQQPGRGRVSSNIFSKTRAMKAAQKMSVRDSEGGGGPRKSTNIFSKKKAVVLGGNRMRIKIKEASPILNASAARKKK